MNPPSPPRETPTPADNPLGLEGIEYVEYATARPQALGQVLERLGFSPVARHRSREVLLYRQGTMNVVVNAHAGALPPAEAPTLAALALRVRDAAAAHSRCLALGAWDAPVTVAPMELHVPAIHGVGASRIYFVDRWRDFSIYDVDFVAIPGVERHPPALAGLHWFGIVQYIGAGRSAEWIHFYRELLGLRLLATDTPLGALPGGQVLQSPDARWHLQLVEPTGAAAGEGEAERLHRVAFGTPDVAAAVQTLATRGVEFLDMPQAGAARGALTRTWLDGVMFELVRATGA